MTTAQPQTDSRHYQIASKDAVTGLHARFLARQQKTIDAALAAAQVGAATPVLRDLALDVLLHVARMRVSNYTPEQLSRVLASAANSNDATRVIDRHKDELTMAVAMRERLASPRFGAAVVPPDKMDEMTQAAQTRVHDERLEHIFAGEERVYLTITPKITAEQKKIEAALARMPAVRAGDPAGYRITDWSQGYATDHAGKQTFRIGKLLREHAPDLLADFDTRTTNNLMVVISRSADDIARASTNRGWHSCAGAGRGALAAYDKMPQGLQQGMLIAYLVSDSDHDVNNPLSRMMLYPFIKDSQRDKRFGFAPRKAEVVLDKLSRSFARAIGKPMMPLRDRIWYPGKNYGLDNADFDRVVKAFVDEKLNAGGAGHYWQPYDIYHPGFDVVVRTNGTTSIKQKFKY